MNSLFSLDHTKIAIMEEKKTEKEKGRDRPCILVLGMAGSGKSTFVQGFTSYLSSQQKLPYLINLDPAVSELGYAANIDIRDTVNYKEVMKEYQLGPNGGIMTALNLYATKFDEVLNLLEKKNESRLTILDTPGQIEVFTWSASGSIITESLASSFPTVILYVVDTVRSTNPVTFMSNMLYACSILYKTKLPFVIVLNKIDIVDDSFIKVWMKDFEVYHDALDSDSSYTTNLARSLSLVLDEFYSNLKCVGVSSITGQGMSDVMQYIDEAVTEFYEEYKPGIVKRMKDSAQHQQSSENASKSGHSPSSDVIFSAASCFDEQVEDDIVISKGVDGKEGDDEILDDRDIREEQSFERFIKQS